MRLYLDDDIASGVLAQLLRKTGHEVQLPSDVGMSGKADPLQFVHTIQETRVLVTRNYRDFENLHLLVLTARGHHPGILVERFDRDPKHNLTPGEIVRAIRNLEAAGVALADQYYVLNHWK